MQKNAFMNNYYNLLFFKNTYIYIFGKFVPTKNQLFLLLCPDVGFALHQLYSVHFDRYLEHIVLYQLDLKI